MSNGTNIFGNPQELPRELRGLGGDPTHNPFGSQGASLNEEEEEDLGFWDYSWDAVAGLGRGVEEAFRGMYGLVDLLDNALGDFVIPELNEERWLGDSKTGLGEFVEVITSFAIPFSAAGKVARGGKLLGKTFKGFDRFKRLSKAGPKVIFGKKGPTVGRVASDALLGYPVEVAVFPANMANLSNGVQTWFDGALANPVTAFLAAPIDPETGQITEVDSLSGRLRNSLEGLGIGVFADVLIGSLIGGRAISDAVAEGASAEAALKAGDDAVDKAVADGVVDGTPQKSIDNVRDQQAITEGDIEVDGGVAKPAIKFEKTSGGMYQAIDKDTGIGFTIEKQEDGRWRLWREEGSTGEGWSTDFLTAQEARDAAEGFHAGRWAPSSLMETRDRPDYAEFLRLSKEVAESEKTPTRQMAPEEVTLWKKDWKAYSKSRGYTEKEIADHERWMELTKRYDPEGSLAHDVSVAIEEGTSVDEVIEAWSKSTFGPEAGLHKLRPPKTAAARLTEDAEFRAEAPEALPTGQALEPGASHAELSANKSNEIQQQYDLLEDVLYRDMRAELKEKGLSTKGKTFELRERLAEARFDEILRKAKESEDTLSKEVVEEFLEAGEAPKIPTHRLVQGTIREHVSGANIPEGVNPEIYYKILEDVGIRGKVDDLVDEIELDLLEVSDTAHVTMDENLIAKGNARKDPQLRKDFGLDKLAWNISKKIQNYSDVAHVHRAIEYLYDKALRKKYGHKDTVTLREMRTAGLESLKEIFNSFDETNPLVRLFRQTDLMKEDRETLMRVNSRILAYRDQMLSATESIWKQLRVAKFTGDEAISEAQIIELTREVAVTSAYMRLTKAAITEQARGLVSHRTVGRAPSFAKMGVDVTSGIQRTIDEAGERTAKDWVNRAGGWDILKKDLQTLQARMQKAGDRTDIKAQTYRASALTGAIKNIQQGGLINTLIESRTMSLLTGPITHVVNVLSNEISGTLIPLEKLLGGLGSRGWHQITGNKEFQAKAWIQFLGAWQELKTFHSGFRQLFGTITGTMSQATSEHLSHMRRLRRTAQKRAYVSGESQLLSGINDAAKFGKYGDNLVTGSLWKGGLMNSEKMSETILGHASRLIPDVLSPVKTAAGAVVNTVGAIQRATSFNALQAMDEYAKFNTYIAGLHSRFAKDYLEQQIPRLVEIKGSPLARAEEWRKVSKEASEYAVSEVEKIQKTTQAYTIEGLWEEADVAVKEHSLRENGEGYVFKTKEAGSKIDELYEKKVAWVRENKDDKSLKFALEALEDARDRTFTSSPGEITKILHQIGRHRVFGPIFRPFAPFISTPMQLLGHASQRTIGAALAPAKALINQFRIHVDKVPEHELRGAFDQFTKDMYREIEQVGSVLETRAPIYGKKVKGPTDGSVHAVGRLGMAAAIMYTAYEGAMNGMAGTGNVRLYGYGSSDERIRKLQKEAGRPVYAIEFGEPGTGKLMQFDRNDFVGSVLGLSTDLFTACFEDSDGDGEFEFNAEGITGGFLAGVANNLLNKSYLRGMSQLMDIVNPANMIDDKFGEREMAMKNFIASWAPMSGLGGQINRTIDPVMKEAFSATDRFLNNLPGVGPLLDLEPKRNILGEEQRYSEEYKKVGGMAWDNNRDNKLIGALAESGLSHRRLATKHGGIDYLEYKNKAGRSAYDVAGEAVGTARLSKYGNRTLRESLQALVDHEDFNTLSKERVEGNQSDMGAELSKVISSYHDYARKYARSEYPELQEEHNKRQAAKRGVGR